MKVVIDIFQFLTSKEIQAKMSEIGVWPPVTQGVTVPTDLKAFLSTDKNKFDQTLDNPVYNFAKDGMALSQEWLLKKTDKPKYLNKIMQDSMGNAKQKAKDALDTQIGIPNQIAALQKELDKQRGNNGS